VEADSIRADSAQVDSLPVGSARADLIQDGSRPADSLRGGWPRADSAPVRCSVEDAQAAVRWYPAAHSVQGLRLQVDSPLPELEWLAWLEALVLLGECPQQRLDGASAFLSDPQTGLGEPGALAASRRMRPESAEVSLLR
jgi:hypothetical protein